MHISCRMKPQFTAFLKQNQKKIKDKVYIHIKKKKKRKGEDAWRSGEKKEF